MSSTASFDLTCPRCQQVLRVPASSAGKLLRCPDCNEVIEVPNRETGIAKESELPRPTPTPPPTPVHDDAEPTGIAKESELPRPRPTPAHDDDARARGYDDDPPPRDYDEDMDDLPRRPHISRAAPNVNAPAICMLVVAVIGLLTNLFGTAVAIIKEGQPVDPNAPPFLQELLKNGQGPLAAGTQGFFALMSALTVLGSVQMLRMKSYWMGVSASILSMINFGNCCCFFGLPFGIWALVALLNQDVRDAFS